MTFEEALEVLGIAPNVGADGARRAYLRLTKTHKPERDPEGFRRIREAYDVVAPQIEWRAAFATRTAVVAAERNAAPAEPDSTSRDADDDAGPKLLDDLEASDDDDFYDFGHEELERPVEMAHTALAAFRAGEFPPLFPGTLLRLLLTLDEHFEGALAAELYDAIVSWNARMGDDRRLFGHIATTWLLVEEYFALRPKLSPDARALVAHSLSELDLEQATDRAATWNPGGQRGDRARKEARRVLRASKHLRAIVFRSKVKAHEVILALSWPVLTLLLILFNPFSSKPVDTNVKRQIDTIVETATNEDVGSLARSLERRECTAARVYLHRLTEDPNTRNKPEIKEAIAKLKPIARDKCHRVTFPPDP